MQWGAWCNESLRERHGAGLETNSLWIGVSTLHSSTYSGTKCIDANELRKYL